MKKEMMKLIDTMNDFVTDFNSQSFKDQKQSALEDFPDVDEYDLGYANGYSKAIYKNARIVASSESEFEEFSDTIAASPLDIVTVNSAFAPVNDDEDDIPDDIEKKLDDLLEDDDE